MFHDIRDRFGGSFMQREPILYCLTAWSDGVGIFFPRR
jgi:hypothetical protein